MSNQNQEKMTKYLDFPYDTFLMLRFEYSIIFDDELEVKLLRIIEYYLNEERKHIYRDTVNATQETPKEPLDITRDIWVPISHRLFMSDLHGKVTSVNTIKKALKSLIAKRIIFQKYEPKKKYDAPEYTINHAALQVLLNLTRGGQKLIPSVIDALRETPCQKLTPSDYQKLIPSITDLSTKPDLMVSNFDTTFNNSNTNNKDKEEESTAHSDEYATPSQLSDADLLAELQRRGLSLPAQEVPTVPTSPDQRSVSSDARGTAQDMNMGVDNRAANVDNSRGTETPADSVPDNVAFERENAPDPVVVTETLANAQVMGNDRIANEATHEEATQPSLMTCPQRLPVMPPEHMPWGAEKLVQITESKRIMRGKKGALFSEEVKESKEKSQRQRQLAAAKKILARGVTEEQYILAYDERNDEWWNKREGSLTVEKMAANTPEGVMRTLSVLEKLESRTIVPAQCKTKEVSPEIAANEASTRATIAHMMDKDIQQQKMDKLRAEHAEKFPERYKRIQAQLATASAQ